CMCVFFFFSSRRRHTRSKRDWSSDVCSSDLDVLPDVDPAAFAVVVLPRVTRLPAAAEAWLDRVRAAGGTVLAVDSPAYPAGIPVPMPTEQRDDAELVDHATLAMAGAAGPGQGAADGGGDSALADALREVLPPPLRLVGDGGRVGTVRRRLADGELHLLANTGPTRRTLQIAPRTP